MAEKINPGNILIQEGARLPESLRFDSEPYAMGWRLIKTLDGCGLDREICKAGWTLFYMANEMQVSVVGFDREKALRKTVKRLQAKVKSQKCNCLEISQVAVKRFLGVPYVTVSAHPRHIQESVFLFRDEPFAEWDRIKLAAV